MGIEMYGNNVPFSFNGFMYERFLPLKVYDFTSGFA